MLCLCNVPRSDQRDQCVCLSCGKSDADATLHLKHIIYLVETFRLTVNMIPLRQIFFQRYRPSDEQTVKQMNLAQWMGFSCMKKCQIASALIAHHPL